jgi:4'-phosphopantetheinyl transferase
MSTPWPSAHDVIVGVADARAAGADPDRLAQSLEWMSAAERARFERFRHDEDRAMFALGRLMARMLVGRALGVAPDGWIWREGPHGRPEIHGPNSDIHFNVSHSAGLVLCAIARGRTVGVDVEDLTRRRPDWGLVERYCSPDEADEIRTHGDRWPERFLTYWTLKEAYLKARGLGISVPLADICFADADSPGRFSIRFERSLAGTDDRWNFHLLRPTDRHLAAIATDSLTSGPPTVILEPF